MWLGKKSKEWLKFRRRWMKNHPPNHEGYYTCYICGKWVKPLDMELDHVLSRSRHPELTFDEQNLKPSCHDCNYAKGSLSLEEYLNKRGN